MNQQSVAEMIALLVLVGGPVLLLYLRHRKHASRLPWKAYPACCLTVCAGAFAAAFFLSGTIDSVFYGLGYAFHLDSQTSALAARLAINLIAAVIVALLAGLYVVKKSTSISAGPGSTQS